MIVSASGMMTGGRVLHHALRLLPNPNATLVFVGFQAAGTRGRRILDGEKEVKILGQWVPVRCRIEVISSFSAHADWKEMIHWLEGMSPLPAVSLLLTASPTRPTRWLNNSRTFWLGHDRSKLRRYGHNRVNGCTPRDRPMANQW